MKIKELFTEDELNTLLEMAKKKVNEDYLKSDELVLALTDLFTMTGFRVFKYKVMQPKTESEIKTMLKTINDALADEIENIMLSCERTKDMSKEEFDDYEWTVYHKLAGLHLDSCTFSGLKNMLDYYKVVK